MTDMAQINELRELTDEMHALRHDLLDEHPVPADRIEQLVDALQKFEEWLREQRRTNHCVQAPKAPESPEAIYQISSTWLTPETIADWKRKGWIE